MNKILAILGAGSVVIWAAIYLTDAPHRTFREMTSADVICTAHNRIDLKAGYYSDLPWDKISKWCPEFDGSSVYGAQR